MRGESVLESLVEASFWMSVGQIILIDILLGGDNAVVIALACRQLPAAQRRQGICWGVAGAVMLRLVMIFFALQLLALPFLKVVGGALLLWIGMKLLCHGDEDDHAGMVCSSTLAGAVKTIIVADAVMSLDNVIAVAGAARGSMALVLFGIVVSIPIIVWGSQFVLRLMDRFPIVVTLGAGLLGWIGGEMLVGDAAFADMRAHAPVWLHYLVAAGCALLVIAAGKMRAGRIAQAHPQPIREILFAPSHSSASSHSSHNGGGR
jgi:YjbE family integral membrane protein